MVDHTGEFGLAKSITISTDGKEAIVELSKGALFHDGSELTADDVIYSFDSLKKANRDKNKAAMTVISNPIVDCDTAKLDSHKVAIRAKCPIDFRNALEGIEIINGKSGKIFENNGQPISAPEGTGPYQIANVDVEGNTITLTANPTYRLGAPRIKKIEITFFKSIDAASMAVLTNKADYTAPFKKMEKTMLGRPGDFTMFPYDLNYCHVLLLNTSRPHLRDARVRRALSLLIDRDDISKSDSDITIKRVPTATFLNNSHPPTVPVSHLINGKEAARLFTEAGLKYVDGKLFDRGKRFVIEISMPHGEMDDHSVRMIKKMMHRWENGGVVCDFKIAPDIEKIRKGEFDLLVTDILERKYMPVTMEALFKINDSPSFFNLQLADWQLKDLIKSLKNETREDVVREKKLAIQQRIMETCPLIPLYYETGYGALGWTHNSDADIKKAIEKDPIALSYLARMK